MVVEQIGLATKNISAPDAVFHMADKRKPGKAVTGIGSGSVVLFKHAPDHIFIDAYSERLVTSWAIRGQPNRELRLFNSTMA